MTIIAGILTIFLITNSVLLIFLVLIQLPKKDAGAGLAFGAGAADALFGAGSGNTLTKITKYGIGTFFVFALTLGYVEESMHKTDVSQFEKGLQEKQAPIAPASTQSTPAPTPAPVSLPAPANPTETTAPAPAGTTPPAK